jgi:hypothetical protein
MLNLQFPIQIQTDKTVAKADLGGISLLQISMSCLYSVFVTAGIIFLVGLIGDGSLVVLSWLSVCAFCALMPYALYAAIQSRKNACYRYLAYGFACLFAVLQSYLLLLAGVFLSGLTLWLLIFIPLSLPLSILIVLVAPLLYWLRYRTVKAHILHGDPARAYFLTPWRTAALYLCLAAAAALLLLYSLTGLPIEWAGYALMLASLVLMILYSREAVALSAYCLLAVSDTATMQRGSC